MQTHPSRSHHPSPSLAFGVSVALVLFLATPSRVSPQAAPPSTPAQVEQTPSRAARLSFVQGNVSVSQTDNTADAQLNQPIFAGTRLSTGDNGQAEIEFEDGSVLRLAPGTTVSLSRLSSDGRTFQTDLALHHGLLYAELRAGAGALYSLAAGPDRITPLTNATVRVQIDRALPLIAALDGTVRIDRPATSPGSHLDLHAGESLQDDPADPTHYLVAQTVNPISWDIWNEARDQAAADAAQKQTAAREGFAGAQGYGWSDLDANGRWYDVPGQGPIWQPDIAASAIFDPYGSGSWIASNPGAYIFASNYTWGWTPFRCGAWSFWNNFGWGWVPDTGCGLLGFGAFPGPGPGFGSGFSPGFGPGFTPGFGPGYAPGALGGILHYPINIHRGPPGYRPAPPPPSDPHRPHPIHPAPPSHAPTQNPTHTFLTLTGDTIQPLPPVAPIYTSRGSTALGAPLRRDFPVDQITRRPLLGIPPSTIPTTTVLATGQPWRSVPARPNTPSNSQGNIHPVPIVPRPYPSGIANPVYANPIHPNPVYATPGFTRYGTLDRNRPIAPNSYPGTYPPPSRPVAPTDVPRAIAPVAPIRSAPQPTITRPTPHR